MSPFQLFLIAVGGALGALARYSVGILVAQRLGGTFPWGTFVINASGSFIIGLVYQLIAQRVVPGYILQPLVGIGFVGAYTTFSTFEYETYRLNSSLHAFSNLVGSVVVGYGCVWIGVKLGDAIGQTMGLTPKG